jgi:hypothetical protein
MASEISVDELFQSVVMAEAALAHILNAEGEKMQKAVSLASSVGDLLELNRSVNKTLANAIQLEQANYQRLDQVLDLYRYPDPEPDTPAEPEKPVEPETPVEPVKPCPKPPVPCPKPQAPCPEPCVSIFTAAKEYMWACGKSMFLRHEVRCDNGVTLCRKNHASLIMLPAGYKFKIEYDMELVSRRASPVTIEMRLADGVHEPQIKTICPPAGLHRLKAAESFVWETPPGKGCSAFSVRLCSSDNLRICKGEIVVTPVC